MQVSSLLTAFEQAWLQWYGQRVRTNYHHGRIFVAGKFWPERKVRKELQLLQALIHQMESESYDDTDDE